MFIELFDGAWLERLHKQAAGLSQGANLYLLIDGVFVPGLYRKIRSTMERTDALSLLFEALPGCTDATRDVSPFLISFRTATGLLKKVLAKCSGWPMVSAIETPETLAGLANRLAAWCIVENDNQRFNFRFPDTRRL
ncbi:DUF4123 domain-containing protein, partial [Massilia glaciei]